MSKPDIEPKQSAAGIAVDPKTLERVIPESRRPDGSVRKQLRVRPGFTPQEDVARFRGSRQQQAERNQLPKGHILGWIAPSGQQKPGGGGGGGVAAVAGSGAGGGEKGVMTKSAAKNAKRKAKKQAEKEKVIRASWEDSNSDEDKPKEEETTATATGETETETETERKDSGPDTEEASLAEELEKKLDVH